MQAHKPRDFPQAIAGRSVAASPVGGACRNAALCPPRERPARGHPMLFFRQPSGPIFPAAGASRLWR